MRLLHTGNIAGEENDAGRLDAREQGTGLRRKLGAVETDDEKLADYVKKNFDFRPKALIEELDLLRPIYRQTAAYGHFGRSEFSWERANKAEAMAQTLLGKSARFAEKAPKKAAAKATPAKTAKPAAKSKKK